MAQVIGRGIFIRGSVTGSEPLAVEGRVEGSIALESSLEIQRQGRVEAEMRVTSLEVIGSAQGSVQAKERVSVRAGGRLAGTVRAPIVSVEEGAWFTGA